jgi:hypothetical protein
VTTGAGQLALIIDRDGVRLERLEL